MDQNDFSATAAVAPRALAIRFTGSGSEYFRIWIVNLLLALVTLGLYLPFAKVRRIQYFYANTLVDGHALGFHGDPWKMFRGFVLLVVLMGTYSVASRLSPLAGLVAFIVLCAVWPALWRASMQFRLGNTSWRGLRFGFEGGLAEAYLAVAPLYLPLIAFIGFSLFAEAQTQAPPEAGMPDGAPWLLAAMAASALATPWFLALTKRYQHNGLRFAQQRAVVDLPTRRMYALCFKGSLIALVPMLLMAFVITGFAYALGRGGGARPEGAGFWAVAGPVLGLLLFYFLWFVAVAPYFAARMQNLVWGATRSEALLFTSRLHYRSLLWLTFKNWTLVLLTLGLYRPFAAVRTARLRLEAVGVQVSEDIDEWQARERGGAQDATGEAAGDFFGIDLGL